MSALRMGHFDMIVGEQTISTRNHSITIDMPQNMGPSMWQVMLLL